MYLNIYSVLRFSNLLLNVFLKAQTFLTIYFGRVKGVLEPPLEYYNVL